MKTAQTNCKSANRLNFLNASALLKWLLAAQATCHCESARQVAERASSELGFTITIHNIRHMRRIIAQEISKHPA